MPQIPIRWDDNTEALKARLRSGLQVINQTRDSAERMTKALSGERLLQSANNFTTAVQRIGGVERLTNAERERGNALLTKALEKYQALGQQAPAALQQLAAATSGASQKATLLAESFGAIAGVVTAGAIIGFGRQILTTADNIQKMSDQTGLTTAEVQKLSFVASQSGTSMQSLVSAVQNLQQRLGSGDDGATGAIAKLRINLESFKQANTFEQMLMLGDAISSIKDPTERASLAAEIFGKNWKEILPAINSGMRDVAESAPIMADAAVKSLDRVGDALDRSKKQAEAWGGSLILAIEGAGFAVGDFFSKFNPSHFGTPTSAILRRLGELNDPTGVLGAMYGMKPASAAPGSLLPVPKTPSDAMLSVITKDLNDQLREKNELTKDAADAYQRAQLALAKWSGLWEPSRQLIRAFSDELANLTSRTFDFQDALDQAEMNPRQIGPGFMDLPNVGPSGRVQGARDDAADAAARQFQKTQAALQSLGQAVAEFGAMVGGAFGELMTRASNVIGSVGGLRDAIDRFGAVSINATLSAFQLGMALGQMLAPAISAIGRAIKGFFGWLFGGGSGPGAMTNAARMAAKEAAGQVPGAHTGGMVTPFGIQRFAVGGMVQPSFGRDSVHIMAEPGEVILNRAQQQNLASGMGGVSVVVNLNPRGVIGIDGHALRRWGRELAPAIAEAISQNKNSSFTKFRAATGQTS